MKRLFSLLSLLAYTCVAGDYVNLTGRVELVTGVPYNGSVVITPYPPAFTNSTGVALFNRYTNVIYNGVLNINLKPNGYWFMWSTIPETNILITLTDPMKDTTVNIKDLWPSFSYLTTNTVTDTNFVSITVNVTNGYGGGGGGSFTNHDDLFVGSLSAGDYIIWDGLTWTNAQTGAAHAAVTMSGAYDYITLAGQNIVRGQVDLATDVTGVLADGNVASTIARDSEVQNATNDLNTVLRANVTNHIELATNDLNTVLRAALQPASVNLTNWSIVDTNALDTSSIVSGIFNYNRLGRMTNHTDVTITSLTLGDHLAWNGSVWTNGPAGGGSGHAAVTLSGSYDYITLSGQDIVRGQIDLATDITGTLADGNIVSSIARDSEMQDATNDLSGVLRTVITNHVTLATNGTVAKALAATHSTNFWGQLNVSNYNNGTDASTTTWLRGDGTWVAPSGSTPTTTRGDLIVRGASADVRLPLGSVRGDILQSDGTDALWMSVRKNYRFLEEWFRQTPTGGELGWAQTVNGAGASNSGVNYGENSTPGYLFQSAGTTSSGNAAMYHSQYGILLGADELYYEVRFRVPTLSTATEMYEVRAGLSSSTTCASDWTSAIGIRYCNDTNSAKFEAFTYDASTQSRLDTGLTVAAATWYVIGMHVNANATTVTFYTNGVSCGTISAYIPKSGTKTLGMIHGIKKLIGTTARSLELDYDYLWIKFGSSR